MSAKKNKKDPVAWFTVIGDVYSDRFHVSLKFVWKMSRNMAIPMTDPGIIFAAIIALCLFIAFGIVRALKEMIVSFQGIAEGEGDLTKRIDIQSRDEIAELAGRFDTFLEKLNESTAAVTG